jgi:hypothetical protein
MNFTLEAQPFFRRMLYSQAVLFNEQPKRSWTWKLPTVGFLPSSSDRGTSCHLDLRTLKSVTGYQRWIERRTVGNNNTSHTHFQNDTILDPQ